MFKIKIPTKSTYFSSNVITHLQMADEIFEFAMKWVRLFGANIFDKGYETRNIKVISTFALAIFTIIINIYDIFLFQEDMVRCVFCLLIFSALIQALAKLQTFVWMSDKMINLRQQTEKFHENFSSLKLSKIFEEKFMVAAHVSAGLTVLYICTFILLAIYPFIFYLIMNEKISLFGIEIPFINLKDSWIGFGINFAHQILCAFIFFCGSIGSLCTIICFITSGICQFDVLKILLDELNELIIQNKNGSKDDEICNKIKFLMKIHLNLIDFLHELKRTFAPYYFIEFGALVFQKTVELFAIMTVSCLNDNI